MKILIIRHGDPDYTIDSLTEKGKTEAELLSDRISKMDIKKFYVSPLGRAKATADYTLKKMNRKAEECNWLREFEAPIIGTDGNKKITWDWLPAEWTVEEDYYRRDLWHTTSVMQDGNVISEAERVYRGLDEIIASHGYEREGNCYKAVDPNCDTIVLFCHFGVECVMLGHLLGISPMVLCMGLVLCRRLLLRLQQKNAERVRHISECFHLEIFHIFMRQEKNRHFPEDSAKCMIILTNVMTERRKIK